MKRNIFLLLVIVFFIATWGAEIVKTFDAPENGISGLAHNGISLYACSDSPSKVFKLSPETGEVLSSWDQPLNNTKWVAGAGWAGDLLYIGTWESTGGWAYIYKYDQSDQNKGSIDVFC